MPCHDVCVRNQQDARLLLLQVRERELNEVRVEKEKSRLLAEDLQLKLRSSRREVEAISTTLRNARRTTK